MKTQILKSNLLKGLICAVIAACFTINVQAKPLNTVLKSDTGKMDKMNKMNKMSKSKMSKSKMSKGKMDKMSKSKMSKMSKDSTK